MTSELLHVHRDGTSVGTVSRFRGRITFVYDQEWRADNYSTPLSTSMPLSGRSFDHETVEPWLWGLLPDDVHVVRRWCRDYGVRDSHPLGLLGVRGEDVPGAFSFLTHGEEYEAQSATTKWLSHKDIEGKLAALRVDGSAWSESVKDGRWSLAGAQAKFALRKEGNRWGVPSGLQPSTHIVKPAIPGLADHDINEYMCLAALRALGVPAAHSEIMKAGDERAIVVQRFDRAPLPAHRAGDPSHYRIHQEDLCQALCVHPSSKYESDGGPGAAEIAAHLRDVMTGGAAEQAVAVFADSLILNWLLLGTDAHAKNYSLLLDQHNVVLAPLYDVASALPYDDTYVRGAQLAMKIGGEYRASRLSSRHWVRCATSLGLNGDQLLRRANELCTKLPEVMADVASRANLEELCSDMPHRLSRSVADWCGECQASLG